MGGLTSRGSILFGNLKMNLQRPQLEQIPTNGRKSKRCIVIQRYRPVSLGNSRHAGVADPPRKVGFCGRNALYPFRLHVGAEKGSHPPQSC